MERTDYNGELRLSDVGREVKLVGWVSTRRRLGAIEFIDLRDNTGIVQLMIKEGVEVPDVRNEYVISVTGTVSKKEVPNPKLPTGEIEIIVKELKVVNKAENPPFIIADKTDALEETRLQYRYLDLRRPEMQRRLRVRAKIVQLTHEYLDKNRFLEVETPILNLATPEGARDYIVPSRLHHGSFYALPQSPQLFTKLQNASVTKIYALTVSLSLLRSTLSAPSWNKMTSLPSAKECFRDISKKSLTLTSSFLSAVSIIGMPWTLMAAISQTPVMA